MNEEPELHRDPNAAEEMAANAVLKYLHECEVCEQAKADWIERVFKRVKTKELTH